MHPYHCYMKISVLCDDFKLRNKEALGVDRWSVYCTDGNVAFSRVYDAEVADNLLDQKPFEYGNLNDYLNAMNRVLRSDNYQDNIDKILSEADESGKIKKGDKLFIFRRQNMNPVRNPKLQPLKPSLKLGTDDYVTLFKLKES